MFLQNFAANFLLFLLFAIKNAKNEYFDQRLGCAAPQTLVKIYNNSMSFYVMNLGIT